MIALSAILTLAPTALAQQRRTIIVRRYYVVPRYDPFYDPFFYSPYRAYAPPTTGDVKLKTDVRDAMLYVDGGFVGEVKKNKRISLGPGTHEIELRNSDGVVLFSQNVNVMLGKTTEIQIGRVSG